MTRKQIVDKALKRILEHPGTFWMDKFKLKITKAIKKSWRDEYGDSDTDNLDCGTVCCFAGEVVIAAKGMKHFKKLEYHEVRSEAEEILGLDYSQARTLFYPGSTYYLDAGISKKSPGTPQYAKAAVKAVKNYFKDNPLVEVA